jgi:hypothetical protein
VVLNQVELLLIKEEKHHLSLVLLLAVKLKQVEKLKLLLRSRLQKPK